MQYVRFAFILVLILFVSDALAQCAMCKAVAESSLEQEQAAGLNRGILFLMGIPYLLMGVVAFVFFRKQIVEKWNQLFSR